MINACTHAGHNSIMPLFLSQPRKSPQQHPRCKSHPRTSKQQSHHQPPTYKPCHNKKQHHHHHYTNTKPTQPACNKAHLPVVQIRWVETSLSPWLGDARVEIVSKRTYTNYTWGYRAVVVKPQPVF